MAKSLASHISSKGRSQSGAIKIGASVKFGLIFNDATEVKAFNFLKYDTEKRQHTPHPSKKGKKKRRKKRKKEENLISPKRVRVGEENFSTWSLAFSPWRFSSLHLEGYGIDGFWVRHRKLTGVTTGLELSAEAQYAVQLCHTLGVTLVVGPYFLRELDSVDLGVFPDKSITYHVFADELGALRVKGWSLVQNRRG
ncbi:hypothetical protein Tco_0656306 [Tanacetum coccineum]|uniref:Uncharacterized protein n=1 Tax=Tanacetum coccineum TaxID=301880 RepID=A0ABQ4X8T0_9ASTR